MLKFKGDSVFNNFHKCKVDFDGRTYDSSEAAYQSMKVLIPDVRNRFIGISAYESKQLGNLLQASALFRADWEEVKYNTMLDVLRCKFGQHPDYAKELMETGDETIIEDTTGWHDKIWGKCYCSECDGAGENLLGKALMQIREELIGGSLK